LVERLRVISIIDIFARCPEGRIECIFNDTEAASQSGVLNGKGMQTDFAVVNDGVKKTSKEVV
jgi:hypothetical protein